MLLSRSQRQIWQPCRAGRESVDPAARRVHSLCTGVGRCRVLIEGVCDGGTPEGSDGLRQALLESAATVLYGLQGRMETTGICCMTLAPPHSSSASVLEPLVLPWGLRLSPEQFALVCQANPDAVLELTADGQLIAMTPTGSETGARNSALLVLLALAVRRSGLALKLFDSSSGFLLPDGSVLSPDASLLLLDRWSALTPEQRRGFAPLCPDLVVELASPSDDGPRGLSALRQKMELYRTNGAQLGWLLIPSEQAVEIWSAAGTTPQRIAPAQLLDAAPLFPDLQIELADVWAG